MIWPERRTRSLRRLAAAILASEGCAWGYDLMKAAKLQSGTVYPLLSKMEQEGWLTSAWEVQSIFGDHAINPRRRYYQLTEKGAQHLKEL